MTDSSNFSMIGADPAVYKTLEDVLVSATDANATAQVAAASATSAATTAVSAQTGASASASASAVAQSVCEAAQNVCSAAVTSAAASRDTASTAATSATGSATSAAASATSAAASAASALAAPNVLPAITANAYVRGKGDASAWVLSKATETDAGDVTVTGSITAASLNASGDANISGAYKIGGVSLDTRYLTVASGGTAAGRITARALAGNETVGGQFVASPAGSAIGQGGVYTLHATFGSGADFTPRRVADLIGSFTGTYGTEALSVHLGGSDDTLKQTAEVATFYAAGGGSFACNTVTARSAFSAPIADLGQVGTSNSPTLDFHSSASSNDYDVRLQVTGGDAASGHGTLTVSGAGMTVSAPLSAASLSTAAVTGGDKGAGTINAAAYYANGEPLDTLPVGAVILWYGAGVPARYLELNGAELSQTTYAALYAQVGNASGSSPGAGNFCLVDMRGEFPRGFDNGRGVDPGHNLGGWEDGLFQSHTHTLLAPLYASPGAANSFGASGGTTYVSQISADIGVSGGSETRPRNIALKFCIKY